MFRCDFPLLVTHLSLRNLQLFFVHLWSCTPNTTELPSRPALRPLRHRHHLLRPLALRTLFFPLLRTPPTSLASLRDPSPSLPRRHLRSRESRYSHNPRHHPRRLCNDRLRRPPLASPARAPPPITPAGQPFRGTRRAFAYGDDVHRPGVEQ